MENNTKILLVEDEAIIAIAQKQQLEKFGYTVKSVSKGEEAIAQVLNNDASFDVILMDIDLGSGIDGTRAAEEILKIKDVPIVFLSSHTEPHIVEKTEKITSYGYAVKNSGIVVLDASIRMALKLFAEKIERKLAEEAMHTGLTKYKTLFNIFPMGITVSDKDGNIIETNSMAEVLLGIPSEEHIRRKVDGEEWKIIDINGLPMPPDEFASVRALKENRLVENVEMGILRQDGTATWINVTAAPLPLDSHGVVVTYSDITSRKRVEMELIQSEARFRSTFDNSPAGSVIVGLDKKFIRCNSAFCSFLGYDESELTGKTISEITHPEDVEIGMEEMKQMAEGKLDIYTGEKRYIRKDGDVVWGEISISLVRESDGRPLYFLPIIQDITDRKAAEEALNLNYVLLQIAGETAHFGGWSVDLVNNVCTWSDAVADIHEVPRGYSPPLEEGINFYSPEWREKITQVFTACAKEGIPYDEDMEIITSKGKRVWVRTTGKAVKNRNGTVIKVQGSFQDITERKQAGETIKKQLMEKETMLREVHHRIKNNMANIEGLLLLQADSTSSHEAKTALQDSIARIQSMRILYDRLLLTKEYEEISFKSYIESLIDSFIAVFGHGKNITINKEFTDFRIDSKRAISAGIIFNELLTNVFKYAFTGREGGIVSIIIDKRENFATIIIHDNGIGIDETTDVNNSSGLGLTIVKMLAEQLNGTYTLSNENGTKSVVEFEI